jgi:hypothetical protein
MFGMCDSLVALNMTFFFMSVYLSCQKCFYGSVCLRCCGCISLETQLLHVWLRKKRDLLFMGPAFYCVCNAGTIEAAWGCFVANVLQQSKQWRALQQRNNQPFPFPFSFFSFFEATWGCFCCNCVTTQ